MKKIETAVKIINSYICNKDVIEIACGSADFSICASEYALNIQCIDLTSQRLNKTINSLPNVLFSEMDAAKLAFGNESFDTVIAYNAAAHLESDLIKTISESLRVTKNNGSVIFISSWKMDHMVFSNKLIPYLIETSIKYSVEQYDDFAIILITK